MAEGDAVPVAQEPVDGARLVGQQRLGRGLGQVAAGDGLVDGLGHTGCGLARRGGEGHLKRPLVVGGKLVEGSE